MAPITNIFRRDDTQNETVAFNLLIALTVLFFVGCVLAGSLIILRRIRSRRAIKDEEAVCSKKHRRNRHTTSIAISHEKAAFLADEPSSPTESVPEIRITFPEDTSSDGKRQSRIVIVKIGEKGSVGYEPYQEPLPVYKEKESPQFENLDLERIGGLREKETRG